MFGAEELWTKGHTGAKVKMAIFDTGIRADHPHFRNIKVNGCLVSLMLRGRGWLIVDELSVEELYRSVQIGPTRIH
jgi:subtilisin family serine protease